MEQKTTEQHLLLGDSKDVLKTIKDGSIDLLATDPPYGIEFMGKSWDKVLPPKEIWTECYRVLKPGSFIAVMSSPRSDVLYRMIKDLEEAGFDMSFSPILWTYHTGFPKASDTSKMIDKRGGRVEKNNIDFGNYIKEKVLQSKLKRKEISSHFLSKNGNKTGALWNWENGVLPIKKDYEQLKTILELDNNFDDLIERYENERLKIDEDGRSGTSSFNFGIQEKWDITKPLNDLAKKYEGSKLGFQPKPAVEHIIIGMKPHGQKSYIDNVLNFEALPDNIKMTYPFLQVPKPAKKEKDMGTKIKNHHPTSKPVKLMSYIITLFTREGDWVLDPFLGSGTTGVASKLIGRNFVGIEREQEYMDIVRERCEVDRDELIKFFKEGK
jgi:DNA modification methylase